MELLVDFRWRAVMRAGDLPVRRLLMRRVGAAHERAAGSGNVADRLSASRNMPRG